MTDEWITTEEASTIIGVTPDQVRKLIRRKKLVAKRFGWAWMVSQASAEAYAASERKPGPKPGSKSK